MSARIRPMQAVAAGALAWPSSGFWVQPKFDGLGCIIDPRHGPRLLSGAEIPCRAVREALGDSRLNGLHGELTAPGGLEAAQSGFMRDGAPPAGWRFTAFDDVTVMTRPFEARLANMRRREDALPAFALISPARFAARLGDAVAAFAEVVADHRRQEAARQLDGLILKSPLRRYHEGKASAFRGEALKLKPMNEGEAEILDVRARRDDPHALASVQVRRDGADLWAPMAIDRAQARSLWADRTGLIGRDAVLRWWGLTSSGRPRHAVAVALRRDREG